MKSVRISGVTYSLSDFAKQYDLSYTTVVRYYSKGFRNRLLLEQCEKVMHKKIKIGSKVYKSKNAAAKSLGISKSTFYRKYALGKLDDLVAS